MSTEKFTPGEWETVPYISWFGNPAILIHNEDDGEIAIVNYHRGSDGTTEKANTALIAAAPEMYRMLEQLHGTLSKVPALQKEIKRVLKKARGEE